VSLALDSGAIYSALNRADRDFEAVGDVLRSTSRPHVIVEPVLVEVDYWIRKFHDVSALDGLVADIVATRYELVSLEHADLIRITEFERQYEDADVGFVDASIVAVCERLNIDSVLTFDRRDFAMIRPRHTRALKLLP
jgi:hypothetical protein